MKGTFYFILDKPMDNRRLMHKKESEISIEVKPGPLCIRFSLNILAA